VVYKHINNAVLQAAEDKKLFLTASAGLGLLNDSAWANKMRTLQLHQRLTYYEILRKSDKWILGKAAKEKKNRYSSK